MVKTTTVDSQVLLESWMSYLEETHWASRLQTDREGSGLSLSSENANSAYYLFTHLIMSSFTSQEDASSGPFLSNEPASQPALYAHVHIPTLWCQWKPREEKARNARIEQKKGWRGDQTELRIRKKAEAAKKAKARKDVMRARRNKEGAPMRHVAHPVGIRVQMWSVRVTAPTNDHTFTTWIHPRLPQAEGYL